MPANYSVATNDAGTGPYRVEFTIPAALNFYQSGPIGTGAHTSVQFVASVSAPNVNLGVNNPDDYAQSIPNLATPCYVNGDVTAPVDALVSSPYNTSNAFRQGHNLHKLTLDPTTIVVLPIFPPSCL